MMKGILAMIIGLTPALVAGNSASFETDTIKTSTSDLQITFISHGTLMLTYNGKVIHVDPWGKLADYAKLPKADIILITHEHQDHCDPVAINVIKKANTAVLLTRACAEKITGGLVMKNGDAKTIDGIKIEAVPAYNIIHKRDNGQPYHPKGAGNGYIISFGDKKVYIGGDTENIPEMKNLKDIEVAFLPVNLPYTMTPEMAADAVKLFNPRIFYPYHYGETDTTKILEVLKTAKGTEIRIRKMK